MQDTEAHAYDNYTGLTGRNRKKKRLDFKALVLGVCGSGEGCGLWRGGVLT